MSGPTKRERRSKESSLAGPETEVEALLRAAQDDLLLKLRVDSHPISSRASSTFSSDALDSDLARRFEALKSPPPPRSTAAPPPPLTKPVGRGATALADDEDWGRILGDDLAARFAAIKGSSNPGPNPGIQQSDLMTPNLGDSDGEVGTGAGGGDGVSEKEVEKVVQWAMDAARLDPSKGNGGEKDDDDDGESTDDDDDDDEEDLNEKKRKEMNKGKLKKKFFFF